MRADKTGYYRNKMAIMVWQFESGRQLIAKKSIARERKKYVKPGRNLREDIKQA